MGLNFEGSARDALTVSCTKIEPYVLYTKIMKTYNLNNMLFNFQDASIVLCYQIVILYNGILP